ncbi:MAG: hypothetical protein HOK72_05320 [Flavobacteriales bacterium]|nr:hypothetical protein [Flavobacteriales bacterium]
MPIAAIDFSTVVALSTVVVHLHAVVAHPASVAGPVVPAVAPAVAVAAAVAVGIEIVDYQICILFASPFHSSLVYKIHIILYIENRT